MHVELHPKTAQLPQDWFMDRIDEKTKNVTLDDLSRVYQGETFYSVKLDDRVIKSMYKDELLIPSRALAVALAEEWESQMDYLDMRTLFLNNMIAKGIRAIYDEELLLYMQDEMIKIIQNDNVCFVEPANQEHHHSEIVPADGYKLKLRER